MTESTQPKIADVACLSMHDAADSLRRSEFCRALHASLVEHGFVRIRDHGIDIEELSTAYDLLVSLFNLPTHTKKKYVLGRGGERGYTAIGVEKAAGSDLADLKEFWHIGPQLAEGHPYSNEYPENLWPDELPELREFFLAFYQTLADVADQLFLALGESLGVDQTYFSALTQDGNSVLRLIHYPALSGTALNGMDTTEQMRAAAHTDINLLTLLVGASDSGLQLLDPEGRWCDIPSQKNEIIVDSGDMMALLTGGTIPSTVHRVINPANQAKARYSMPFFVHPHSAAVLQCLPQLCNSADTATPITAGEYLAQRLAENGF